MDPNRSKYRSDHDKKYDRQIRLWGPHGQKALEHCHIGIIGSSALAAETMKNLCLANIHSFTMIDHALVETADLGNNFFVDDASVGRARAEIVTELLMEMNPDVKGQALIKNPTTLIHNDLNSFEKFSLVIVTQLADLASLKRLSIFSAERHIPLLVARVYGLVGIVRVAVAEHTIIESKPETDLTDLCLFPAQQAMFPELSRFIDSFDLSLNAVPFDSKAHSHVPFAAILGQQVKQFSAEFGHAPLTASEQDEFKERIKKQSFDFCKEVNFCEAIRFAYKAYSKPRISSEVQSVLESAQSLVLNASTSEFWVVARAVSHFVQTEGGGFLPVTADIPDMHSDSDSYVMLKKIVMVCYTSYHAKHLEHVEAVKQRVSQLEQEIGRQTRIEADYIERFVKNVRTLHCMRLRSLDQELAVDSCNRDIIVDALSNLDCGEEAKNEEMSEESPIPPRPPTMQWYVAMRAVDSFFSANGRLPNTDADAVKLKELGQLFFDQRELDFTIVQACYDEMYDNTRIHSRAVFVFRIRWNACEIHTMASLIGGVASQEATKLIVSQYVPINNTFLYDGIHCVSETWEM